MTVTKIKAANHVKESHPKEWRLPPFIPVETEPVVLCYCPVREKWFHSWDEFMAHTHLVPKRTVAART